MARDPSLDITINCLDDDAYGNEAWGIFKVDVLMMGSQISINLTNNTMLVDVVMMGTVVVGQVIDCDPMIIDVFMPDSDVLTELFKQNWVQWSNIGKLDFTIWKDNVAGKRPLDWKGYVYQIKKLQNRVIIYGENGVTIFTPSGSAWGMQTIYRVGLKGKNAVAGTDFIHYFVDRMGQLWSLAEEGLTKLDYNEYLSLLNSNLVLTYDELNDLLYICDGTYGHVYRKGSFGKGPINVSGLGYQSGTLYVTAPATITTRIPEICTDIYDMGTRSGKSIQSLEIGTDLTATLQAAIDYRFSKGLPFNQTGWYNVDSRGVVFIPCYGYEFRFRFRLTLYQWFKIDYIKANGLIHVH